MNLLFMYLNERINYFIIIIIIIILSYCNTFLY